MGTSGSQSEQRLTHPVHVSQGTRDEELAALGKDNSVDKKREAKSHEDRGKWQGQGMKTL